MFHDEPPPETVTKTLVELKLAEAQVTTAPSLTIKELEEPLTLSEPTQINADPLPVITDEFDTPVNPAVEQNTVPPLLTSNRFNIPDTLLTLSAPLLLHVDPAPATIAKLELAPGAFPILACVSITLPPLLIIKVFPEPKPPISNPRPFSKTEPAPVTTAELLFAVALLPITVKPGLVMAAPAEMVNWLKAPPNPINIPNPPELVPVNHREFDPEILT